ncbi:MAG: citrate/2-methylcitrate synthase [Eubacterium sp.]|nr:citrate/2-methylcitrate synthase [Eubacterium sp.]
MPEMTAGSATREINKLAKLCEESNHIQPEMYDTYHVKKGLREPSGKGVLTGLTEISTVVGSKTIDGVFTPVEGELRYRGINIKDLVNGFTNGHRFGYEETVYLLLFGRLPSQSELEQFTKLISYSRKLPTDFTEDVILKNPNKDVMNAMAQSILALNAYDKRSDDLDIPNVLRQCISLIATLPMIGAYSYLAYRHYMMRRGLYIHNPKPELSTAENLLRLLRQDKKFDPLEAQLLDIALVLHAEHGGGNNSTFTTHVVTSSGTDTYSSVAASLCSLKGPKHGGANIQVIKMFDEIKTNVSDWYDDDEIAAYLKKILDKKAFDKTGLIYGMGHAVYSLSDPRAEILKKYTLQLAEYKGRDDEAHLYKAVGRLAPQVIAEHRKIYKGVCTNIDFYSGFAYDMLNIPREFITPLFAIGRISGWSAHRIEELLCAGKIIRPAYMSVSENAKYVPINER